IEQELGRNLAARVDQRGHRLLAVVNFWLGVCQWAAGDPQRATASFVRSAQLPGAPTPDGKLLPPSLVRHYRKAVAAPREQTTCQLDASVRAEDLLVDGKGPTLRGGALDVPAGTHYVVLRGRCPAGATGCVAGARSMRLEARGMGCRVRRPSAPARSALVCINGREAADASFVRDVAREGDLAGVVVVSRAADKIALRVLERGRSSFRRELVSDILPARGKDAAAVVRGSLSLLLGSVQGATVDDGDGDGSGNGRRAGAGRDAWYRKWWIWTIVGVAAAATITGIAVGVASGTDRVDIVFSP
ncbi:MAG: hypothetical protein KC503_41625, partial [Myxococcales bacterium]|nr:hypothetical protein [Myxococcales bacterium]